MIIHAFLQLNQLKHISHKEFERLKWLSVIDSKNVPDQFF